MSVEAQIEARCLMLREARRAKAEGASFDVFVDRSDPDVLALMPDRELDAIFNLIWKSKRGLFR